ncbi:unnamed protein product [Gongylonema pulchrum]|nr:unnamed protein product [Gongylonema pulchrum]
MLSQFIEIENVVDLRATKNFEMAMRLQTTIESGDEFFTDLNAFQMIKRRRFEKLPLQAHFYPMSASAFIEDKSLRMTLLTAQPLGVASLTSGHLEVMLDRRLNQDDGRGLFSVCA